MTTQYNEARKEYNRLNRATISANKKKWAKNNPIKVLDSELNRHYGPIAPIYYKQQWYKQEGACAICNKPAPPYDPGRLSLDHDHSTMTCRGLLCIDCNSAIGLLRDNPKLLIKAANYIDPTIKMPCQN